MSKQHKSPANNRASAPYNFVPLPEKVLEVSEEHKKILFERDRYYEDKFTGYIDLLIKTETPLYTRCAFPPSAWDDALKLEKGSPKVTLVRECQDFFYRGDKAVPVIPGSTLRGMTRSLVEIFSYSKINFVTDSQLVYRSIRDPFYRESFVKSTTTNPQVLDYPLAKVKGGYLKVDNGKHYIIPAKEDDSSESFVHVEYGDFEKFVPNFKEQNVYKDFYVKPPASRLTRKSSNSNIYLKLAITNEIENAGETGLRKVNVVVSGHMEGTSGKLPKNKKKVFCDENGGKFIDVLIKQSDDVSKFLLSKFSQDTKNQVEQYAQNSSTLDKLATSIIFEINGLLKTLKFEDEDCFKNLSLSENAKKELAKIDTRRKGKFKDEMQIRYNRIFLDEAYSSTIKKHKVGMEKHMHCAVYELNQEAKPIEIPEERWKIYQDDYKKVLDKSKPQRELKNGEPLFYFLDKEGKPVFGSTMMFRLHYKNTVRKFLDEDSKNQNILDFTDVIFGKVPEKRDSEQKSFAGRVYFSDAVCQTASPFLDVANDDGRRVPKILSSPKPTAFQLYLNQPDPNNPDKKNYNSLGETQIRGFKRYWHKPNICGNDVFDREKEQNINDVGSQHTVIRPVKPNVTFTSRVYFENLSNIELGALLTSLELPHEKRHQIGMAKPYGLGSVEIKPTLVLQNRRKRYESLFDGDSWATGKDASLSKNFKKDFADKIIEFHNNEICQNDSVESLEGIPRLKQLYTMLEWDAPEDLNEKIYIGIPDDQWSKRFVLPFPQHVGNNNSGEIFVCLKNQNLSQPNSIQPVAQLKQPAPVARTSEEIREAQQNREKNLRDEIQKLNTYDKETFKAIGKKLIRDNLSEETATIFLEKIENLNATAKVETSKWFPKLKSTANR